MPDRHGPHPEGPVQHGASVIMDPHIRCATHEFSCTQLSTQRTKAYMPWCSCPSWTHDVGVPYMEPVAQSWVHRRQTMHAMMMQAVLWHSLWACSVLATDATAHLVAVTDTQTSICAILAVCEWLGVAGLCFGLLPRPHHLRDGSGVRDACSLHSACTRSAGLTSAVLSAAMAGS